jgi:hypothetical protein
MDLPHIDHFHKSITIWGKLEEIRVNNVLTQKFCHLCGALRSSLKSRKQREN